ncbi:MAG: AAA family ATPase [Acidobacteriia bacterium]|nr:AAA family ATPase [Terriglobia bacterium]
MEAVCRTHKALIYKDIGNNDRFPRESDFKVTMYERFFGLEKAPFSMVPDPNCVHLTAQHGDAISGLVFGIMERRGYLLLTGEAGLGKTTALGALSQLVAGSNVRSSLIFNPTLDAPEFLEMVLLNFGFQHIPSSKTQRLKILQDFLIRSDAEGAVSALIVDEAHKLSAELLEEVRLLGNFEASDRKLLQIVLAGQNELVDRLNLPELWQLKQRIAIRMSLKRLDRQAVEEYIRFRWGKAGGAGDIPFTNGAVEAIAKWSGGVPRLINGICDNALLIAFSDESHTVDVPQVREACKELDLPTTASLIRVEPPVPTRPALRPVPPVQTDLSKGLLERERPILSSWADSQPSLLKRWLRLAK